MSVEKLILKSLMREDIEVSFVKNEIEIFLGYDRSYFWLDCSQAHLLMLYLQEHLNGSQVSDGLDKAIDDELKHKPKDIME